MQEGPHKCCVRPTVCGSVSLVRVPRVRFSVRAQDSLFSRTHNRPALGGLQARALGIVFSASQ